MPLAYKIKPVLPRKGKGVPTSKAMKEAIDEILDFGEKEAIFHYERTVQTWSKKPQFRARRFKYMSYIYTDAKIYMYIDKGVAPRVIVPRKKSILKFRAPGFKAKTKTRTLASFAGTPGKGVVWARRVTNWPGIKARNFTERVGEEVQKDLGKYARKVFKDAV